MKPMSEPHSVVFVVDDDAPLRESLKMLLNSVGLHVELFASATQFLAAKLPDVPSCLVLDVRLPGLSGLDFQAELASSNIHIPIIFITAFPDERTRKRALGAGAIGFLSKPCREELLIGCLKKALLS